MFLKIQKNPKGDLIYIFNDINQLSELIKDKLEKEYIANALKLKRKIINLNRYSHQIFLLPITKEADWEQDEEIRKTGVTLTQTLNHNNTECVFIENL